MTYDDVANHLADAGSFDRAAQPLGVYLAWCANHRLLSEALSEQAAPLLLRLQMRDVCGSELAVAGCGGSLEDRHLNSEGRAFTAEHYRGYLEAFLHSGSEDPYDSSDCWARYDRIAPLLTRRLMEFRGEIGGSRPWWRIWS